MPEPTVVVVGGGVTGLAAARRLRMDAPQGTRVVLLEASERLGGKLKTEDLGGIQIEAGADSFLAREPEALHLCAELGLREDLVTPAIFGAQVWTGKRLQPLPSDTVMGIPIRARSILGPRLLTPWGKARALGDLVLPGRLHGNDISVGTLIRRRFGSEVLDRMVDPVLAGTRAGAPDEMSLRAALPQVDRAARSHRSLMLGLRRARRTNAAGHPLFFAPRDGMQALIDSLRRDLDAVEIRTGHSASRITAGRRGTYIVETHGGESIEASGAILSVPSPAAAGLLADLSDAAASGLSRIRHASVAVVMLTFPPGSLSLPRASSGILVPQGASRTLSAATWWSEKWPHAVPDDRMVVRAFVGRHGRHAVLDRPDDALVEAASEDLGTILGTEARPSASRVVRWEDGLPQYEVGHGGRISRIEAALEPHPGIVLAGADYRGPGIPDCIRQADVAARRVAAHL